LKRLFLRSPLKYKRVSSGFDPSATTPSCMSSRRTSPSTTRLRWERRCGPSRAAWSATSAPGNGRKHGGPEAPRRVLHDVRPPEELREEPEGGRSREPGRSDRLRRHHGQEHRAPPAFALRQGERAVNPFTVVNPPLTTMPERFRKHFDEMVRVFQAATLRASPRIRAFAVTVMSDLSPAEPGVAPGVRWFIALPIGSFSSPSRLRPLVGKHRLERRHPCAGAGVHAEMGLFEFRLSGSDPKDGRRRASPSGTARSRMIAANRTQAACAHARWITGGRVRGSGRLAPGRYRPCA